MCAVLAFLIPAKELRGSHGAFQVTQATPERAGWTSLGALRLRSPASGTLRVRAHSRVSPSHQRRRGRSKFFSGPACTVLQNDRKVSPTGRLLDARPARARAAPAPASEPEPPTEARAKHEATFLRKTNGVCAELYVVSDVDHASDDLSLHGYILFSSE